MITSFASCNTVNPTLSLAKMTYKNPDFRCKGRTKSGKPCRAAATKGGLCFFHANPDKASELGRIGGMRNRHHAEHSDPLPNLDNALAVRDTVARLIADVYDGKINPRIAAGLAPLLNLQMRAIETTDLERRLVELEKAMAAKDPNGRKDTPSPVLGAAAKPIEA
jgi:hypothetical protein